jgi:peroxiredoxin
LGSTLTLQDDLNARRAKNAAALPPAMLAAMDHDVASVAASGIADRAARVGDPLPRATLLDVEGNPVTIDEMLAEGPLVISVYRGGWCPYCNVELRALESRLEEITATGGRLVAVSPMSPDASLTTAEKHDLGFPVLSDVGLSWLRALGLVHSLSDDVKALYDSWGFQTDVVNVGHGDELPLPATFVVAQDGTISWRHVDPDYVQRADPDDIVAALRDLA